MVRTQVQLTEEQHSGLRRLAAAKRVSMARLIREGVDKLLTSEVAVSEEEAMRRALAVMGRYHSGKSDISKRHDDYIAEAMGE